eukprot:COSAG01_NODE_18484_length_1073_cov_0.794661_2_plen_117_part_00
MDDRVMIDYQAGLTLAGLTGAHGHRGGARGVRARHLGAVRPPPPPPHRPSHPPAHLSLCLSLDPPALRWAPNEAACPVWPRVAAAWSALCWVPRFLPTRPTTELSDEIIPASLRCY